MQIEISNYTKKIKKNILLDNINMKNMKQSFKILSLIYLILIVCAVIFKDSPAAVISAVFGITYTFLAGKGNPICYLFGVTGSGFYSY